MSVDVCMIGFSVMLAISHVSQLQFADVSGRIMENYLKNGTIKYKFKRILLDKNLKKKYLFSHNDILKRLKAWNGSTNQNKKHFLLRSNYPWLFSSRNEIKPSEDLATHKILPIIALSEIGRKSLTALKNIILHDKYAHIIELLTRVGVFRKWSDSLSRIKTTTKPYECLVHGVNIMMKKKIMYHGGGDVIPSFFDCHEFLRCLYANDELRIYMYYLEALAHYKMTHGDMETILSSQASIQFIRSICEIILGNNRKIISYLQGKESAVRTAVPKRVLSCRAQISLAPYLKATQIGLPYWWAKYCNFHGGGNGQKLRIFDVTKLYTELPQKYIYKLSGQRILAKRDPIIHILAFCVFDEVFFHTDSRCKIGAESLKKTASDFDGDTWILYFTDDLRVMYEIDFNASPRYNMALHGQCRINLIESIVLSMYKRNVDRKIPHWRLYNFIRQRAIYRWLMNIRNCSQLDVLARIGHKEFPIDRLYRMVEPTDVILADMLMVIYMLYGSKQSYNFYCELLRLSMELSLKFEQATLYQPDLPCDYTLTSDLMNFDLLAVSLSCAKGSIHTYKSLLDKVYDKDKTTSLACTSPSECTDADDNFDYEKLIADITNANIFAAKKSKQVPQQGYNLFKDTIEGDLMSFGGNRLNYENEVLIENIYLRIPLQYVLDPVVAYTILYEEIICHDQ